MEAAAFEKLPLSGDYDEYDFGESGGERFWVKFTDDEAREWCGKFSFGWKGKEGKVALLPGGKAFVLVGGQGYFIDIGARALLCRTRSLTAWKISSPFQGAICWPRPTG